MDRITFEGNFCDIAKCQEVMCPYGKDCSQKRVWERLKYYEDMEEQGRLVVLPCQWGTKLYSVFAARHNLLDDGEPPIREIQLVEGNVCSIVRQFGKTVFLTREKAEQALKGGAVK